MVVARHPLLLVIATGLAACGSGSDKNPVKAAFAQRPTGRPAVAPVAFRLPAATAAPIRIYRIPRFEEVSRRFETPGFTTERVVAFSDDDDQVFVLSTRGSLLALDLGTGRSRTIDSGVTSAVGGPDGASYVTHGDSSVAYIEHRVPKVWPKKLPATPTALVGAGRGMLLVEARSGKRRELIAAFANRPAVTQEIPEGPIATTKWGELVGVATDTGVLLIDPLKVQKIRRMSFRTPAVALAFSPSGHRVFALYDAELGVADRYSGSVLARAELPGAGVELRPDPFGRFLLIRPSRGDSIWIVDAAEHRYLSTVPGSWSWDLPTIAPDGSVLTRQGSDLVALTGDPLTNTARVRGTPNDRWLAVSWDPRGPVIDLSEQASMTTDSGAVLYVQVSSSLNEAWAQDFAQNLKRAGLNASVLAPLTPDEGFRVVLGPYPTREAAEDAGRKLGRSYWVFSREQAPPTP